MITTNNMQTFIKKPNIQTQEYARQHAIDWQTWASEQSLSYSELVEWGAYFTTLAEKHDLIEEFKENAII